MARKHKKTLKSKRDEHFTPAIVGLVHVLEIIKEIIMRRNTKTRNTIKKGSNRS